MQLVQLQKRCAVGKESIIFPERESRTLEFKAELLNFEKLVKTCIALANGAGGQIIIGVEDQTRRIIGITDKDRDRLYDEFPNSLYDSVSPTLLAQIYEKRIGEQSVLIIQIPPNLKKPYFMKTEGFPKGVYVRVGTSTRRASQDYVEDLVREGNRLNFDEEIVLQDMDILSQELIKQFYGKSVSIKKMLSDRVIILSSVDQEIYHPTVMGVLFFTENPHLYLSEASVICTCFQGDKGRDIIQTQEMTGPINKLAEDSLKLVVSWISRDYKLHGAHLKGEALIPEEALREAIINALIHRKYSVPGAVKISIYEHHLDVFSPGCFPGLVDLGNLGDGTTFLRNPHITRMAHRMGLVEKMGSGIRLIFDSCMEAHVKQPVYQEGSDAVKITFYFEPIFQEKQSEEEVIFSLIKVRGKLSIQDVMASLGISRNTATRKLNKFIKEKRIIREGSGPSVRYRCLEAIESEDKK